MKYGIFTFLIICLFSCNNELNIVETYKDIPVVYGMLSVNEDVQYIRVEKAFIDENISGFEIAKIPDSIYYQDAIVSLENVNTGATVNLTMVDATNDGFGREEGVFATNPNYLYKISSSELDLTPGTPYKLIIERSDVLPIVEAQTILIDETRFLSPSPNTSNIDFNYTQFNTFRWRNDGAAIYDLLMRINYRERINGGTFESKSVLWPVAKNVEDIEFQTIGQNFYSFIAGSLSNGPEFDRRFDNVDVILDAAGVELLEFNRIASANLGITSSQDVPTFSNLSEGLGIFSSKSRSEIFGIGLSPKSLDSLMNGQITQSLNFN